jgi:hypothetical protein
MLSPTWLSQLVGCRRSANSLAGRSRNSAPGPGVDGAVASFLSSMSWGVIGGAGHLVIGRAASRGGAGWACPCFLPEGAVVVSGVKAGPAGSSPQAMRSGLEAGGAAPYPCAARPLAWSAAALGVSGGVAATFWSWRARPGGGGLVLAGAAPGPVALAFQEQVVAGVEDPVKDGLADDRVGEQRVPV